LTAGKEKRKKKTVLNPNLTYNSLEKATVRSSRGNKGRWESEREQKSGRAGTAATARKRMGGKKKISTNNPKGDRGERD